MLRFSPWVRPRVHDTICVVVHLCVYKAMQRCPTALAPCIVGGEEPTSAASLSTHLQMETNGISSKHMKVCQPLGHKRVRWHPVRCSCSPHTYQKKTAVSLSSPAHTPSPLALPLSLLLRLKLRSNPGASQNNAEHPPQMPPAVTGALFAAATGAYC